MTRGHRGAEIKPDGHGLRFQELVSSTLQPDFTPDGVEVKAPEKAWGTCE